MLAGLVRLTRPYYGVPISLTYLLTVFYALGGQMAGWWPAATLSMVSLFLAISAGYVFNDVCDFIIDRTAPAGHPLAEGIVTRRVAIFLSVILAVGAIVFAVASGSWMFTTAISTVLAGLAVYDITSKRLGAGKQLLVAVLMTSFYPLAVALTGWPTGPRAATLAIFPLWLLLTSFGYEVLKDIRDRQADPDIGGKPTPIQRRSDLWRNISRVAIGGSAVLLIAPAWFGCKWVYLIGAVIAITLAIASMFVSTRRAIHLVYGECVITALAAAADVVLLGV